MPAIVSKIPAGELDLTERLSQQMAELCMNDHYSDMTFIVEDHRLPANRAVLAIRSEYFRALLYGGLSETNQSEVPLEVPVEAFKILLHYVYTGHMSMSQMNENDILDTIQLANEYGFTEIELAGLDYLQQTLSLDNVCTILDAARLYKFETLTKACFTFIDCNASKILVHSAFKHLSKDSLEELLRRDSFFTPEIDIFRSVYEWCKHNDNVDMKQVLSHIRLSLMDIDDILGVVRKSSVLDPNKLLDAIDETRTSKCLPYRGALWPEENVATPEFNSLAIQGTNGSVLLDGDTETYKIKEEGYASHCIDNSNESIIVELGTISIVNHIKILLWDRDSRSYSYYIEVSIDQKQWECVVDYKTYLCRSWQFLYFPSRAIRYIKLVGTHNTGGKRFHAVTLEAMYTASIPALMDGFVAPTYNVATTAMGATVISKDSHRPDGLGRGTILIQLGQPYHIGSIRLLYDELHYCYYVETSENKKDWEMVEDCHSDAVQSYQYYSFPARPVSFIKIVGTHSTVDNEFFSCLHMECPPQDLKEDKSLKG